MKTTTAFWKRFLPYAGAGVAVLLLAGFLSSCSVTTSPDDSTLAPALGTSLIFEEYTLDLKDQSRDTTKNSFERVHTVLATGLTFAGETNVLVALRQNADTLRLKHKANGDLLVYQPEISVGVFDIPGRWVRLAYGIKIPDTVTVVDSARILGGSTDSIRITIEQTFQGPSTVVVAGKPISTLQLRVVRRQQRAGVGLSVRDVEDATYWYAPSLGYIIQEKTVFTQQIGNKEPVSTGMGQTLIRIEN
ncbi:MAG: hypothetical protein IPM61_06540 [Chlorobi bacterium]|nr:MAG: hypothetical protein UZ07_CHB004000031 [Chlorobi bacterium OLB7]MBK8910970.1 hypothetical protein [Chlorobiota bacterium]MCE7935724.1 hypothetical protein [Chlorobi bacterium CHB2]